MLHKQKLRWNLTLPLQFWLPVSVLSIIFQLKCVGAAPVVFFSNCSLALELLKSESLFMNYKVIKLLKLVLESDWEDVVERLKYRC